jgi:hypothetical protein
MSTSFINQQQADIQMYNNAEHNYEPNSRTSQTAKVTTFLRWSGAMMIILSAASFLVQGHADLLPAYRYWVAMGFILLLAGCGLVCAYAFNETKGTRIFFGLAMVFLPVQISQVSAMFYAYLNGIVQPLHPAIAWWQFADVTPALMIVNLLLTVVLAIPLVYAGFSILARKHRRQLGSAFFISCLALLLPVRDAYLMPVLLAALLLFLRRLNRRAESDSVMILSEGVAARAIIWIPVLIMIGRSFMYPVSFLLPVVLLAYAALWLIHDVKQVTNSPLILFVGELAGILSILAVWFCFAVQVADIVQIGILLLPVALILFLISEKVDYFNTLYRTLAALLATIICLTFESGTWLYMPLIIIAVGVLLIVAGIHYREKIPMLAGVVCFVAGILSYVHFAIYVYQASPWLSSIGLGLSVLLLASYIENKEKRIVQKTKYYFNEFKAWN